WSREGRATEQEINQHDRTSRSVRLLPMMSACRQFGFAEHTSQGRAPDFSFHKSLHIKRQYAKYHCVNKMM
ncbi:hypothetical protein, partial [Mesorhizobium sp. M3A.F.Ca.ET.175.01.1.1]|uniref:hypothetical protein n=1 Tax=Mesorhizobium sp. M3A.F.Ca.ET.175.01.1.1 TaxID=2563945 RepID=UPI001AEF1649